EVNNQGQVTVPNADLPTNAGKHEMTVTEPGKTQSTATPIDIPAKETATPAVKDVATSRDPKTGDVTLTPKDNTGKTY
ncbi:hypothetical protein, partial [Enterococcus faecium]|uniref:hypothetical protein n=1 Tax=Enterococcus faecium TaxID=1352 RepID=UPI000A77AD2B